MHSTMRIAIGQFSELDERALREEIADVIAFLCSARNTYAVGALWEATGGLEIG